MNKLFDESPDGKLPLFTQEAPKENNYEGQQ